MKKSYTQKKLVKLCFFLILPHEKAEEVVTHNKNKSLRTIIFLLSTSFAILPPEPRPTVRRCSCTEGRKLDTIPKGFSYVLLLFSRYVKEVDTALFYEVP